MTLGTELLDRRTTVGMLQLEWDGIHAETKFRLCVKWTSPCKLVGVRIQSTTGSRGVRVSRWRVDGAGKAMFHGHARLIPFSSFLFTSCTIRPRVQAVTNRAVQRERFENPSLS